MEKKRGILRSPLFLFVILPLSISLLIHLGFLLYADFSRFHWGLKASEETPKSILLDIKKKKPEVLPKTAGAAQRAPAPDRMKAKKHPADKRFAAAPSTKPDPGGEGGKKPALGILAASEGADWLKVDPSWGTGGGSGGGPGSGGTLHSGPQGPTQTFAEYIQALRDAGLDIVIVFDSTSSMSSVMNEIKLKIGNLALALRKLVPSCRIGLVAYRDKDSSDYLTKVQPLTYGVSTLQRFLNGIDAVGGGDIREAVDEGLRVAVEGMKWNKKSKSFILLVGDGPPHKEDISRSLTLIKRFKKEMGGTVSVLDVRIPTKLTREQWEKQYRRFIEDPELENYAYMSDRESVDDTLQSFAEAGGGESARLINEEKLIKHMLLYTFGTQWEAYLTEIMKNL